MMILLSRLILLAIIVYLVADVVYPAFSNKEFWWMLKQLRKNDDKSVDSEDKDEASEDGASSGSTDAEEESK